MTPAEIGLSYRRSDLRRGQIVAGQVQLERRAEDIQATVAEMQGQRKAAQPTNKRTFGSVFKNPSHELTAGRMLEACGLRGHRIGGAQISPKHANFIENAGRAMNADAIALIAEARRQALEEFGVRLEPEVQLLGSIEIPHLSPGETRTPSCRTANGGGLDDACARAPRACLRPQPPAFAQNADDRGGRRRGRRPRLRRRPHDAVVRGQAGRGPGRSARNGG